MNLRTTIVQALRDEAAQFADTGRSQYDLASQVLERLAGKIEAGDLTEDEGSVVVPPGGTLVLRLDPGDFGPEAFEQYRDHMNGALDSIGNPKIRILVVMANQLGVYDEDDGAPLDGASAD